MLPRLPKLKYKLCAAGLLALGTLLLAQEEFSYMTPNVIRVGERLGCRCGGCKFTVGNCNMPRCGYANPKRQKIAEMQAAGISDDTIVNNFVASEGAVTLSAPPTSSVGGLIAWFMPGIVLLLGFFVYWRYVKGKQQATAPLSPKDEALIERYRSHMDFD